MSGNGNFRLGATLWLAAMTGVVIVSLTILPQLLEKAPPSVPHSIVIGAIMMQSGVLIALAVWAGVALSRRLSMGAPAIEAALGGTGMWPILRRQIAPATVAGILVGGVLVLMARIAPVELVGIGETMKIPLAVKLLYGGVTEEVLMRWGLMTTLMWLAWRLLQKRVGPPRVSIASGSILVSAMLFGILHLPAAAAMGVTLDPAVVAYVIAGNAVPAIIFGYLYWRHGLESAIVAHALAHIVAVLAMG